MDERKKTLVDFVKGMNFPEIQPAIKTFILGLIKAPNSGYHTPASEGRYGQRLSEEDISLIKERTKLKEDNPFVIEMKKVVAKLVEANPVMFKDMGSLSFGVWNGTEDEVGAVSILSGHVLFNTSKLASLIKTEEDIAMVLSHEFAHELLKNTVEDKRKEEIVADTFAFIALKNAGYEFPSRYFYEKIGDFSASIQNKWEAISNSKISEADMKSLAHVTASLHALIAKKQIKELKGGAGFLDIKSKKLASLSPLVDMYNSENRHPSPITRLWYLRELSKLNRGK